MLVVQAEHFKGALSILASLKMSNKIIIIIAILGINLASFKKRNIPLKRFLIFLN